MYDSEMSGAAFRQVCQICSYGGDGVICDVAYLPGKLQYSAPTSSQPPISLTVINTVTGGLSISH